MSIPTKTPKITKTLQIHFFEKKLVKHLIDYLPQIVKIQIWLV